MNNEHTQSVGNNDAEQEDTVDLEAGRAASPMFAMSGMSNVSSPNGSNNVGAQYSPSSDGGDNSIDTSGNISQHSHNADRKARSKSTGSVLSSRLGADKTTRENTRVNATLTKKPFTSQWKFWPILRFAWKWYFQWRRE